MTHLLLDERLPAAEREEHVARLNLRALEQLAARAPVRLRTERGRELALEQAARQRVRAGCRRCGWWSRPDLLLERARREFAEHRCAPPATASSNGTTA